MTNMIRRATPTAAEIDELVPPPGPRWRRTVGWSAFIAVLMGIGWLWSSGTATPRLSAQGWGHGGEGPVHMSFVLANDSRVAVEVMAGPRDRDGIELLGYTTSWLPGGIAGPGGDLETDPFPVRIEPGGELSLTAWYDVTDCDVVAADTDVSDRIDLRARVADGPFGALTRTRWIEAPSTDQEGWVQAMTRFACP